MMQFTGSETPSSVLHPNLCLDLRRARPWMGFPSSAANNSKSLGSFNNTTCMEQLLVHCANAIEANDATLSQQLLWVLHNIAPPDGDSNQRLTSSFLRALIARASRTGAFCHSLSAVDLPLPNHPSISAVDLASFVDLTPFHRFGFSAANAAIVEATEGFPVVHVVDLGVTHCMQIPTLIDALASRPEGPPFLRLTVPSPTPSSPPPALDLSYHELGSRLVSFARSRNVAMEFQAVDSDPSEAFESLIEHVRAQRMISGGEALVVNCQMLLHYIPENEMGLGNDCRSMFLKAVRGLEPTIVTVVDEDADLTAGDVVGRIRSAFNYLWIPYDAVDTFLARGSEQRRRYEAGLGWRIENVVACEGPQRVERVETKGRWVQRMRAAGFRGVGFGEEAVGEVKGVLDDHAAGWGMKKGEEEEELMLTWKGHNVVFATAWVPS